MSFQTGPRHAGEGLEIPTGLKGAAGRQRERLGATPREKGWMREWDGAGDEDR